MILRHEAMHGAGHRIRSKSASIKLLSAEVMKVIKERVLTFINHIALIIKNVSIENLTI